MENRGVRSGVMRGPHRKVRDRIGRRNSAARCHGAVEDVVRDALNRREVIDVVDLGVALNGRDPLLRRLGRPKQPTAEGKAAGAGRGRMKGRRASGDALTGAVGPSVGVSRPARSGDHSSFAVARTALDACFPNATRILVASAGPGLAAQEVARGLYLAPVESRSGAPMAGSGDSRRRGRAPVKQGRGATDHGVEIVVISNAAEADPSVLAATAPCEVSVLVAEFGLTTSAQARLAARALQSGGLEATAAILLGSTLCSSREQANGGGMGRLPTATRRACRRSGSCGAR